MTADISHIPMSPEIQNLLSTQMKVTERLQAKKRLDDIAFQLWQSGLKQSDVAALMRHADRVAGGSGLSESKATKAMWRKSLEMKAKLEEQG